MHTALLLIAALTQGHAGFTYLMLPARVGSCSQQTMERQGAADSVIGVVTEVNRNSKIITVRTDSGSTILVKTDDCTSYLRVPAGEKTLAKAVATLLVDIAAGDRVLAHGRIGDDRKELQAQRLIVLPKADVEKKRERDIGEWRRRGVAGVVKSLNPQTGEVNLETRGPEGVQQILINTNNCAFRRYAGGSARYDGTRLSTFGELRVGDQLRALGDRSADGKSLRAEAIVSGSFRTIGALVMAVDSQKNEVKAATLDQKRPLLISVSRESELHRIPTQLAALIARQIPANKSVAGAAQPADIQQMIDALPALTLADIKAGDVIAVTSSIESDGSHLTAIKLVAGVDAVLKAIPSSTSKNKTISLSAGLPAVFDFSVVQ